MKTQLKIHIAHGNPHGHSSSSKSFLKTMELVCLESILGATATQ